MIWMMFGIFVLMLAYVSDSGPMMSAGSPFTGMSTAAVSKLGQ